MSFRTAFLLSVFFGTAFAFGETGNAASVDSPEDDGQYNIISGNPAAVDIKVGTGQLGKLIGLTPDTGLRVGGVLLADFNWLITGGKEPGKTGWNLLFILGANADLDKTVGIPGAELGAQFLLYKGHDVNGQAGTVLGYNSVESISPLNRAELYQFWWRQSLFDDKLAVRVGKSVPTIDFTNVTMTVPAKNESFPVTSISSLIYTPLYVNPTALGVMPGYYDSAWGVTVNFTPIEQFYVNWGIYDGSLASGFTTGDHAFPHFNGTYFMIAEMGGTWKIGEGKDAHFGRAGFGGWQQTGDLTNGTITEEGAYGFYGFASQTLWQEPGHNPDEPGRGVIGFFQWGINDSETMLMNGFLGAGATAFGVIPGRPDDSIGFGAAYAWLNPNNYQRDHELMLQTYYQAQVFENLIFQPVISYIKDPGSSPSYSDAWALSLRATVIF